MCSNIDRVPSAGLRRLHRRHRGQCIRSIRSTSLHDEQRRSPRRLRCDATEWARHHEFAALQYGIGEHWLLPEVQNPGLRGGGGGGGRRIGVHGRCVARGETAQACVPPAVRPCTPFLGDMPMQHVTGCCSAAPYSDPWTSQR